MCVSVKCLAFVLLCVVLFFLCFMLGLTVGELNKKQKTKKGGGENLYIQVEVGGQLSNVGNNPMSYAKPTISS